MANVLWQPNPGPQVQYLASSAFEVLFGGRRGGGKSEASLADALHYIHHPNFAGIAFRQTYPELEQLIARSFKFYGGERRGSWNGTSRTWNFPGGASIKFRHLKDANAYRQYLGHEYQWMLFEELTSFDEQVYQQLKGSCRSTIPGLKPSVRATTNPGGKGHAWVKSYFVDVCEPGKVYTDPVTGLTRQYIPCPMAPQILENDPDYVRRLMALPEADRKAWLEGDWDAYTGSVFKLEPGVNTWTWDQFKQRTGHDTIPDHWVRYRVMDWGYARPFAVLWIATDEEGRGYVYREWYGIAHNSNGSIKPNVGVSMQPTVVGQRIKAIEAKEKIAYGWTGPDLDSAGTGDTSAGITRLEYFQRAGVDFASWNAGPDSRKAKKTAFHERCDARDGTPGLIFLTGPALEHPKGCGELTAGAKHCLRTIPSLEYDPKGGGEDIDTDGEDHAYDAVSAWCLMRPWKAKKLKTEADVWQEQFRRRKADAGTFMSQ